MTIVELDLSAPGHARTTELGPDILHGNKLQHVVKAGTWFGAYPRWKTDFAFVGCTVAPAFDFADFELGKSACAMQWLQTFELGVCNSVAPTIRARQVCVCSVAQHRS